MNLIRAEYLSLRGTSIPQLASTGWLLVLDMLNRTLCGEVIAGDSSVLLRTALDYTLIIDNLDLRVHATKVMQILMENVSQHQATVEM